MLKLTHDIHTKMASHAQPRRAALDIMSEEWKQKYSNRGGLYCMSTDHWLRSAGIVKVGKCCDNFVKRFQSYELSSPCSPIYVFALLVLPTHTAKERGFISTLEKALKNKLRDVVDPYPGLYRTKKNTEHFEADFTQKKFPFAS